MELQDSYCIAYRFSFPDESRKEFDLDLDPRTTVLPTDTDTPLPAWTRLEVGPCACCPLECSRNSRWPVAVNLVRPVEGFLGRIKKVNEPNADTNALLILHSRAQLLTGEMNSDLSSTRYLFVGDDGSEDSGRGLEA